MDLTPRTHTNTTHTPTTKSPEAESTETVPPRIQPTTTADAAAKHLTFTNGVLKRHKPHHHRHHQNHHQHHHPPIVITYRECLKNHAANLGGHALDGCGEFMPSPTAIPADPTSLKCAACGCHRNFHRREPEDNIPFIATATATTSANGHNATATIEYQPHHRHHPPPPPTQQHQHPPPRRSPNSSSPPPISSSYYPSAPHMLLALSGNLQNPPPDCIVNNTNMVGSGLGMVGSNSRKRFRTKFSLTQKEKMFEFAERVGWKMQKRDDELVREFCNDVGVDRTVLKVWMHNNKNTLAKQQHRDSNGTPTTRTIHFDDNGNDDDDNETGGGGHEEENGNNNNGGTGDGQNLNHHFESESVVDAHVAVTGTAANGGSGSSSSS